jgi:hypothetical protein
MFALVAVWYSLALAAPALATPADDDCNKALLLAHARTAYPGLPAVVGSAKWDPGYAYFGQTDDPYRRTEEIRFGLELNFADFARRSRAVRDAEAECARVRAEYAAVDGPKRDQLNIELNGLTARKAALSKAITTVEADLNSRRQRLSTFQETRDSVDRVANDLAALSGEQIEVETKIHSIEATLANLGEGENEPRALAENLRTTTLAATRTALEQAIGPSWEFALQAGIMESRIVGEDTPRDGNPSYGQIALRWKPSAVVRSYTADTESYHAKTQDLSRWEITRAAEQRALADKIALAERRLLEVQSDLNVVKDSKLANTFAQRLRKDELLLQIDLADWRARLVAYGGGKSEASSPKPASKTPNASTLLPVPIEKLSITEGEAAEIRPGVFNSTSSKLRVWSEGGQTGKGVRAEFKFQGLASKVMPLGSGAERYQLGVFLAAKNQCNLLYVMWRLPKSGPGEIVVQRKINAKQSTHKQCENRGYQTVQPKFMKKAPELMAGSRHTLEVQLDKNELTVKVDSEVLWSGEIDLNDLDSANGSSGWRSDNVNAEFTLAKLEGKT